MVVVGGAASLVGSDDTEVLDVTGSLVPGVVLAVVAASALCNGGVVELVACVVAAVFAAVLAAACTVAVLLLAPCVGVAVVNDGVVAIGGTVDTAGSR